MSKQTRRPATVTVIDSTPPSLSRGRKRKLADYLFGRRLAADEREEQLIGPLAGVPVLGLDALGSAAYGPEAAKFWPGRTARATARKVSRLTRGYPLRAPASPVPVARGFSDGRDLAFQDRPTRD